MPDVRALKSFKGRYGHIRAGQTFAAEPGYAKQLQRSKLAVIIEDDAKDPGPSQDRDRKEAPQRGGKEGQGSGNPPKQSDASTVPPPLGDGQAITSSSLPAVRASTKPTSPKSVAGGRKRTPTTRKPKAKTPTTPPAAEDA